MKWQKVGEDVTGRRMEWAKVPHGWLVRWIKISESVSVECAFFYPDPLYDWDGSTNG